MKKIIFPLLFLTGMLTLQAQDFHNLSGKKIAILMVHFGTTFDDTRALTIDAINEKAKLSFPDAKVEEAYTSRIIINRLGKRGIRKNTPVEVLLRLAADGYTHVIVQGTNVIDGIEAEVLKNEAKLMAPFFEEIRVGRPLLYSVEDCEKVTRILSSRYEPSTADDGAVVLIGHGTSTPANAIYSQMDYMFAANGHSAFHVATIEGYPTFETTVMRLKAEKNKKVTLIPFMFVAGDHARNDINEEWKDNMEKSGFSVFTILEGLGQIPEIQSLYIEHIKQAYSAPIQDAASQKTSYIKENL